MLVLATVCLYGHDGESLKLAMITTSVSTVCIDQQQELEKVIQSFNLYPSLGHCMCKDRRRMNA